MHLPYHQYLPNFLSATQAHSLLQTLAEEITWKSEPILMFGKWIMQPRLTAWMAEPNIKIKYSGIIMEPLPWHPKVWELKQAIELSLQTEYNSVLINYYRNGNDSMGWHSDNEKYLGPEPDIASLSLGAARYFHLKEKKENGALFKLCLENGSLLRMYGQSQHLFKHQLPKTKYAEPRINLTFRKVIPELV